MDTKLTTTNRVGIQTKYLGPTTHRGSRIRVWRADITYSADPMAVTVNWNYGLDVAENHANAIRIYLEHQEGYGWEGEWVMGGDYNGYFATWRGPLGDDDE